MSLIVEYLSLRDLVDELRRPGAAELSGAVVVRLSAEDPDPAPELVDHLTSLPVVVVGVARYEGEGGGGRALCDVVVTEGDPATGRILANLEARPQACTALALLLRGHGRRTVGDGLVAESATYSTLQSGPEFTSWRAGHPARPRDAGGDGPRVRLERDEETLVVTLTRGDRLNALDARMRDELFDGLNLALLDPSVTRVELRGEGRAFCAGGDLDEFGTRPDPSTAHLVRLQRSLGRVLDQLAARTTAHVHGPSVGSGIELAAFAGTVVALDDTAISLPEVGMGLIPGAGGTVSLPRRIGRLRTAWLALSGSTIDAATARSWGLVDEIVTTEQA